LLQLVLTQKKLGELTEELWRRCRLPLDQACWNAGVDLDKAVGQLEARKRELRDRGVPAWRTETVRTGRDLLLLLTAINMSR
jgi:molecular chaperone DnaK